MERKGNETRGKAPTTAAAGDGVAQLLMVMSGNNGLGLLSPSAKYPTTHTHQTDGDQVTSVRRLVLEEIFRRVDVHTDR